MRKLVEKYLHLSNHFQISTTDLALQLSSHPDHPSIKSLTDTLDYFNIDNIAASVPVSAIQELPYSFLAVLNELGDNQIVLIKRKKGVITVEYDGGKKERVSFDDFKRKWTGTFIAIEPTAKKVNKSSTTDILGIIAVSFVIFAALLISSTLDLFDLALIVTALIGAYLSLLIISEELGRNSKVAMKMCESIGGRSGCTDVISSKNGKLLGSVQLSDLSLTFFIGLSLLLLIQGYNWAFSFYLSLIGMGVVIYSVFLQGLVLRKWCALCLCVGVVVVSQILLLIAVKDSDLNNHISNSYIFRALLIFAGTFSVWHFTKPAIIGYLALPKTKFEFLKFKRNLGLFMNLLHQRPIFRNDLSSDAEMIFGPDTAKTCITIVTNPLCGYCTEAFDVYKALLVKHPDHIKIRVIFSVPVSHTKNPATQIALRIVEIFKNQRSSHAWRALSDWFEQRDVERWFQKYSSPEMLTSTREVLDSHHDWCEANKINYTPATIIENYLYPNEYAISDLTLLMGDLLLRDQVEIDTEMEVAT